MLTDEQTSIMDDVREHARLLAEAVTAADTAGISTAYLLPELITILRDSGFPIPAGLPLGLLGIGR